MAANTTLAARGRAESRSIWWAAHMEIAAAMAPVVATPIVAISPGAITEYVGSSRPPYQPGPPGDRAELAEDRGARGLGGEVGHRRDQDQVERQADDGHEPRQHPPRAQRRDRVLQAHPSPSYSCLVPLCQVGRRQPEISRAAAWRDARHSSTSTSYHTRSARPLRTTSAQSARRRPRTQAVRPRARAGTRALSTAAAALDPAYAEVLERVVAAPEAHGAGHDARVRGRPGWAQ